MDNKFDKYKNDLIKLANQYMEADDKLNKIEKEIIRLRNIKDLISNQISDIKSEETELINKIEDETGEAVSPDLLFNIIKNS